MNYAALIQNRRSVRQFREQIVPFELLTQVKQYYQNAVRRLIPQIETTLYIFGTDAREALEGAAGYHKFLVGAPQYLVLLSSKHPQAGLNAGFVMEDMVLKLADLGLDSCWVTFTDSELVKDVLKQGMSTAAFDMWYGSLVPASYNPDTNTLYFEC